MSAPKLKMEDLPKAKTENKSRYVIKRIIMGVNAHAQIVSIIEKMESNGYEYIDHVDLIGNEKTLIFKIFS
jgi:hypothetical protein